MRALLVDHDPQMLESMTRAMRDICVLDTVTTKDLCLEKLRGENYVAVIVCDRLADGYGLELLAQIAQRHPSTLRAFAADPRRLMQMRGRLGPFNLFQAVRYPIVPTELRAMLKSAQAAQAANADTTHVQHIVLEGDESSEPAAVPQKFDQKFEIAPDWRPEDAVLAQATKPLRDEEDTHEVQIPQWTVEGSTAPDAAPGEKDWTHVLSTGGAPKSANGGRNGPSASRDRDTSGFPGQRASKVSSIRGPDFSRNIGAARALVHETQTVVPLKVPRRRMVIVLTRDKDCLDVAVAALAGQAVSVMHANDEDQLAKALKKHGAMAVLVDLGISGTSPRRFLERLSAITSETCVVAVGRASDTLYIAPLLSRGIVARFLVKPMSRAQTRTAFEAVLKLPADPALSDTREAVPFASIIDRVTATDLRQSLETQPWHKRLARISLRNWHWALGGILGGVGAMIALALILSG